MEQTPYEVVARLFAIADDYWPNLVARYYQIDLLEVSLTKFLDLTFAWCQEQFGTELEWERFLFDLTAPMPGHEKQATEVVAEAEGAEFMAAMSTLRRG